MPAAHRRERCRDAWPLRWADDLLYDLRFALRGLRRTPAFATIAVTVLLLGIGANTALFSVISAVLLRPLPYPDGSRLVRIWTAMPTKGYPRSGSALPDYRMWREVSHSLEEMGASHNTAYNLAMLLLGGFAGVALMLTTAGLYGVMTYTVNQRRGEFGVRLAMGATSRDLIRLIAWQGLQAMATGIFIGLVLASAFSRFVSGQLFEVKPLNPPVYAAAVVMIVVVGALACVLPAIRASRLDPASTLRHD